MRYPLSYFTLRQTTRRQGRSQRIALLLVSILLFQNLLPLMGHGVGAGFGIKQAYDTQVADPTLSVMEPSAAGLQLAACGMTLSQMGFTATAFGDKASSTHTGLQVMTICPACMLYHLVAFSLPTTATLGATNKPPQDRYSSPPHTTLTDKQRFSSFAIRAPPAR